MNHIKKYLLYDNIEWFESNLCASYCSKFVSLNIRRTAISKAINIATSSAKFQSMISMNSMNDWPIGSEPFLSIQHKSSRILIAIMIFTVILFKCDYIWLRLFFKPYQMNVFIYMQICDNQIEWGLQCMKISFFLPRYFRIFVKI